MRPNSYHSNQTTSFDTRKKNTCTVDKHYLHPGPTLAEVAGTRTVTEFRGTELSSSTATRAAMRRRIFSS